ncbi:hypothetical protein PGLA_04640 [Paenibacillus glacialis]|uniref:Uncharacterized protein n=1 Tax=Paenibacillus glacialis TaxID=494026 RepID=A0A162K8W9_9BACL|nr:hypothetical protein PGLA_04640 [Paenibacillus glacialis]
MRCDYTSVNEAIQECERHFKRKIMLPKKLLQIAFTHELTRCSNKVEGDDINSKLEIEYFNEFISINHYQIWEKPFEHKYSEVHLRKGIALTEHY